MMRKILHILCLIGIICNTVYSFTCSRDIIRADGSITHQHQSSYQRTSVSHQPLYMNDVNQQQQQEVPTIRQDDASTLPQLLHSLWGLISYASKSMTRGVSLLLLCVTFSSCLLTSNLVLSQHLLDVFHLSFNPSSIDVCQT